MGKGSNIWNKVDRKVFLIGGLVCFVFVLWAVLLPQQAADTFNAWLAFFGEKFGWLYLLVVSFFVFFLIWLCCSKYGKIVLGKDDEKPQYSNFTWFFMLFAAGMGIGLVFWSVAEPMSHYLTPPYGEGSTLESAELAMKYSFMHWGLHPWACFGVVGLPLAYFSFRKGKPALLSSCLEPLVGERHANGLLGSIVNVLAVFATVFGVATSLGLGAMQINSGLQYVFGVPYGNLPMILIILVVTLLFIASSVRGIDKGIRILSNINMGLFGFITLFVLLTGPTLFLFDFLVSSTGDYLSSFIHMSFWTDAFDTNEGWLTAWTVFYWAWWISWGPFVGGFLARISRGRTIREFVLATLVAPVVLSFVFIDIMGGTAIYNDVNGMASVAEAVNENTSYALFAMLSELPLTAVTSLIAVALIAIFFITSADSSTFVCSMMTAKGVQEPPKSLRIFWGGAESAVAIVLLLAGGLSSLQTASIVAAFPFMLVCLLLIAAFVKAIRRDPAVEK